MYKLKFELEQHTPIIHFQAKDAGATLRASEVKPKLDKFILKEHKEKLPKSVIKESEEDKEKKEDKEVRKSLDYKMRIIAHKIHTEDIDAKSAPMYFGNLKAQKPKLLVTAENVQIIILVKNEVLKDCIKESIVRFFQLHNFGTRQSKGYGSFTVKSDGKKGIRNVYKYSFDVSGDNYKEVMNIINYFYKSLRSGINEYRGKREQKRNILYFKSALHYYVTTVLKEQWDKKSIKEYFFPEKPEEEDTNQKVEDSPKEKYDFRDLLGFSADEAWGQERQVKKNCKKETNEGVEEFSRLKSPIQFKPIRFRNKFTVFFDVFPEYSDWNNFLGSEVCVEAFQVKKDTTDKKSLIPIEKESLTLKVPTDIDLNKVLRHIFLNMDPKQRKLKSTKEGEDIFNGIKAIYEKLHKELHNELKGNER
ncbi:hypothetical protein HQ36_05695 [Porphyromonas gingivicanis]|uniref:Uncharacterized protein n=1 Tax=Porphyromonas gingivicanis TaxID=266762 RepID=A0A0A2G3B5_9PORP|nr:hypothetical protein [Porphyromonas gingivicanis]KGN97756.1 hypothetical protein HQ36_05695 [Porphyromonas gingivicanis]